MFKPYTSHFRPILTKYYKCVSVSWSPFMFNFVSIRACGVVGSAFALQAKGHWFDSCLVQYFLESWLHNKAWEYAMVCRLEHKNRMKKVVLKKLFDELGKSPASLIYDRSSIKIFSQSTSAVLLVPFACSTRYQQD